MLQCGFQAMSGQNLSIANSVCLSRCSYWILSHKDQLDKTPNQHADIATLTLLVVVNMWWTHTRTFQADGSTTYLSNDTRLSAT